MSPPTPFPATAPPEFDPLREASPHHVLILADITRQDRHRAHHDPCHQGLKKFWRKNILDINNATIRLSQLLLGSVRPNSASTNEVNHFLHRNCGLTIHQVSNCQLCAAKTLPDNRYIAFSCRISRCRTSQRGFVLTSAFCFARSTSHNAIASSIRDCG